MSETDLAKRVRPPTQLDRFAWEFFPPIAAIVLFGLLAFYNLRNIRLNEVDTETANHALGLIEQLQRDLLNAETGQRGYLLTGDLDYLEPYYQARGNYQERIRAAEALIKLPAAVETLKRVEQLTDVKFAHWAEALQTRATEDREQALAVLMTQENMLTTDEILRQLVTVQMAVKSEVDDSIQRGSSAYFNALLTFAAALIMTLAATIWSLLRVDRELQRRRLSEQLIRHRTGQLQLFADVVARIFSARDIESITGVALNEFRQLLGAREALLRLSDNQGVRYERSVVATDHEQPSEEHLSTIFEWVDQVSHGESTFIRRHNEIHNDEEQTPPVPALLNDESLDSVLSAPLRDSAQREIGRIVLMGKFGEDFTDHDRLLISQLAYSVSVAIENAKLTAAMEHEANRKDEFLAMLGHELRNPLAGVLTGAQAMMQLDGNDPDAAGLKQSILRQAQMMGRIVDDLLDVSRIARGKITLAITELDLKHLVTQTVDDYRRNYPEREFHVELAPARDTYFVSGDPTRVAQCLSNLLHNACKFSPPDKPIVVKLDAETQSRPMARIDVIDQGVGLSLQEQNIVCDPFQQTRTTLARSQGGLGIGLTLVKGLIEMHGGQLSVTSPGTGCGSTFSIRLPLCIQAAVASPNVATPPAVAAKASNPSAAASRPALEARPAVDPQPVKDTAGTQAVAVAPVAAASSPAGTESSSAGEARPNEHTPESAAAEPAEVELAETSSPRAVQRVLVIDDRLDAILPIRVILRKAGHEVFEAHDGPSGVQLALDIAPDLILCDIGLPGKWNGYDVVNELRQHPTTRDTYIVALSGYSQPADRQRAQEAGFDLHLAKPIDGARLRELIQSQYRLQTPN